MREGEDREGSGDSGVGARAIGDSDRRDGTCRHDSDQKRRRLTAADPLAQGLAPLPSVCWCYARMCASVVTCSPTLGHAYRASWVVAV